MEQAALLEEESDYSYVDSEYMSDEEMLMQEFPDNPTYAQMLLETVKSMENKGAAMHVSMARKRFPDWMWIAGSAE